MFQYPQELYPEALRKELLRLAKLDRNWVRWHFIPDEPGQPTNRYQVKLHHPTWLERLCKDGADYFSLWAASNWMLDGPKVFRPTLEQCQALGQIEVNLQLTDYAQPFPALLIDLPQSAGYAPFENVLCFRPEQVLICTLHSRDHLDDITTTVAVDGRPIEASLQTFDEQVSALGPTAGKALRVAVNSCLCLVNYGCHKDYLYPKEVANDQRLAKENSPRGQRARQRLQLAPELVQFNREVILHKTEGENSTPGEPTGHEISSHWRRGHWAMQPYGPGLSLRKRILRPPVLVRADKFLGEKEATTTIYRRP